MAHMIDMTGNRANMAFVGDRSKIWHGLGQELTADASIETWQQEAGMDWNIMEGPVMYQDVLRGETKTYDDKKVLYRGDTGTALSVVGADYNVVQPHEVLEFFRDLVAQQDMSLDTAGCLFGGRRFWALANMNRVAANEKDNVKGYLLLVTSADGTLATQASMIATRVVCNNTLTVAINEESENRIKVSHRRIFDPMMIKQNMGLLDSAWDKFKEDMKLLCNTSISDNAANQTFIKLFSDDEGEISTRAKNRAEQAFQLYMGNGMGAQESKNTLWGVLNAITEQNQWHNTARSSDTKLWSTWYGAGAAMNDKAYNMLMAMAA